VLRNFLVGALGGVIGLLFIALVFVLLFLLSFPQFLTIIAFMVFFVIGAGIALELYGGSR